MKFTYQTNKYKSCKGAFKCALQLFALFTSSLTAFSQQTDTISYWLNLQSVEVTAKKVAGAANMQKLSGAAIQHQQSTSVADLMQLLPGVLTENPDLNSQKSITIRTTQQNESNEQMGVAVIADGVDLNQDSNLQQLSATNETNKASADESANKGADMRPISTDAIESLTIIRGVAPAEYGNLTSGAVIVNYSKRPQPLNVVLKTDPRLKSASATYGFNRFNFNADYALSLKDERQQTSKFQRFGGRISFNQNISHLNISASVNGYYTKNTNNSDEDIEAWKNITHSDASISLSSQFKLSPFAKFMPLITLDCTGKIQWQNDETEEYKIAAMPTPYTNTMQEGYNPGNFYPVNYTVLTFVHGKPIQGQIKLALRKAFGNESFNNSLTLGAQLSLSKNKGEGKGGTFLPVKVRPRAFSDIPALGNTAIYLDNKTTLGPVQTQLGVRATHINAKGYNFNIIVEPRLSAQYQIIKQLAISASWGIQSKLPTLNHLYPDPLYDDYLIWSQATTDSVSGEITRKCFFSTNIISNTANPDLKVSYTTNAEFTLTADLPIVKLTTTYYSEILRNGYNFTTQAKPFIVHTTPIDTTMTTYKMPTNGIRHKKWGIEYVADFASIKPAHLSIYVDGALQHITTKKTLPEIKYSRDVLNGFLRPYAALTYGLFNVTENTRFNTNVRFIWHIPQIGMVATIKTQAVWLDRSKQYAEHDGHIISKYNPETDRVEIQPVAIIDKQMNMLPYTTEKGSTYMTYGINNALSVNKLKPYGQVDIKISKDFARHYQLSVYVNNITNTRPKRLLKNTNTYTYLCTPTYFGADLRIHL